MQTIVPPLSYEICKRAISKWGDNNQMNVVVEECSELVQAIMKYNRHTKAEEWRLKCVEEAADVSIMLEQLIEMISNEKEFQEIRNYKLKRLNNLIDCDMKLQTCENDEDCRCTK